MSDSKYIKRAHRALHHQMKIMAKIVDHEVLRTCGSSEKKSFQTERYLCRQEKKRSKKLKRVRHEVKKNLLSVISRGDYDARFEGDCPDEDRAIVNEAISARFNPCYIKVLLLDYPKACDCVGGNICQVEHPIHLACSRYHEIISYILQASPSSASQLNDKGMLPIELYLKSIDIDGIDSERFSSTIRLLVTLHPCSENNCHLLSWGLRQEAKLQNIFQNHIFSMEETRTSESEE